ncbi:MAG: ROK family protein [Prevotella sp.]|nr:ROK family protein [Prevotella sp.]MBQ8153564.1 ROK family protein [Prevotella sp.]
MNNNIIKRHVVGVDVSTDLTTYAIVDVQGVILAKESFPTSDYPNVNEYVSVLSEKILMLVESNGGYESVRSVGISAPSGNFLTGSMENAANMPWKGHVPLAAMLRDRLGLAVALGNDAHVTAVGEKVFGAARGLSNFVVVTISHGGLGSCVFIDGHPHLGSEGFAGEFGHICINENGRQCSCGRRGCLEEYASARGLAKTVRELIRDGRTSILQDTEDLTPQAIADACEKGDEVAIEAFQTTGRILGNALATYASLVDPESIILTGGMTVYSKWMLDVMKGTFEANIFQNLKGKVKIVNSPLNNNERDVVGASALAWEVKEYSLFK